MASAETEPPAKNSPNECNLRFLMVNGESFRMSFPWTASVRDVKQTVIEQKPSELIDFLHQSSPSYPAPSKVDDIRILYLGKFLDDAKILNDCGFLDEQNGVVTVHISCRVPSSGSEEVKSKLDKKSGACCVIV